MGVWIETATGIDRSTHDNVTPYVGVWIETKQLLVQENASVSLLMWECGLKQSYCLDSCLLHESLLMWECGLKPAGASEAEETVASLLMWECGLKPVTDLWMRPERGHSLCGSVD